MRLSESLAARLMSACSRYTRIAMAHFGRHFATLSILKQCVTITAAALLV